MMSGQEEDTTPRSSVRLDIQGLRALAVLLVVVSHFSVSWLPGGYVGVDVFFVVSGYLISDLLFREMDAEGQIQLGRFFARRARRILPAATLVLAVTTLYATTLLPLAQLRELVEDVWWTALFVVNVHFARLGTDYFAADRATSAVQHYWSLSVEEQFYLVWPVLLVLVLRATVRTRSVVRRRVVPAVLGYVLLSSLALSVLLTTTSPTDAYFSSLTRAWELAAGGLLAVLAGRLAGLPAVGRSFLSAGGLVAVVVAAVSFDQSTPFPGVAAVLPVAGTVAVLAAGAGAGALSAGSRLLTLPPLPWLGDVSYSLYLWHWPVVVLGPLALVGPGATISDAAPAQRWSLAALVVVLAWASYTLVEMPFRTERVPGFRRSRALLLWPTALGVVLAATTWSLHQAESALRAREEAAAAYYARRGGSPGGESSEADNSSVESRLRDALVLADQGAPIPPTVRNLEGLTGDGWQADFTCVADWEEATVPLCPRGDPSAPPTMVLYGDSHAGMWLPPLSDMAARAGVGVLPLLKLGCVPFDVPQHAPDGPFPECPAFRSWARDQIATLRPDVVVVTGRALWAMQTPKGAESLAAWESGVARTVEQLGSLGARVVVLADITRLPFTPGACLTDPEATLSTCVATEESVTLAGNARTRRAAEDAGATYVDVTKLVCRDHRCPLVVGDVATYHDRAHISRTWGDEVAQQLWAMLELVGRADGAVHQGSQQRSRPGRAGARTTSMTKSQHQRWRVMVG